MPIAQYNKYFTNDPKAHPDAAQKVYDNMIKEYGEKKGKQIFYAKVNMAKRVKGNG